MANVVKPHLVWEEGWNLNSCLGVYSTTFDYLYLPFSILFISIFLQLYNLQAALWCMEVTERKKKSILADLVGVVAASRGETLVLFPNPDCNNIILRWKRDQLTWFIILVAAWCDVPLVLFARILTKLWDLCAV